MTPQEFLLKFKELALAQPLIGFTSVPRNHLECVELLNKSTNKALMIVAAELIKAIKSSGR